jgi:hypothetical protein
LSPDRWLGILHSGQGKRPNFVYDLIEPICPRSAVAINSNLKALVFLRRNEEASDGFELLGRHFDGAVGLLLIPTFQLLQASFIRGIHEMEHVTGLSGLKYLPDPGACPKRIGGIVEHDRYPVLEQRFNMRTHDGLQASRILRVGCDKTGVCSLPLEEARDARRGDGSPMKPGDD